MTEHEAKAREIADRHGGHETLKKLLAADIAVALDEAVKAERLAGLQSRITFMEVNIEVLKDEIAAIQSRGEANG